MGWEDDEGNLALRKLEDSLPGKSTRPTVTTDTYQLEGHQLRLDPCHRRGLIDGFCDGLSNIPIGRTRVTTRVGLPMSTDWKDTSHDSGGIPYVYQLEGHESRLGQDCLCLPIGRTRVTTWARLPMSTNWKDTK